MDDRSSSRLWVHIRNRATLYRRLFFLCACFFAVAASLSMFSSPAYKIRISVEWIVILWILFSATLLIRLLLSEYIFSLLSKSIPALKRHPKELIFEPEPDLIKLAEYYMGVFFASKHSRSLVETLTLLLDPPSRTSRVSQKFKILDERYSIKISRTIHTSRQALLIPIIRVQKGKIVGDLRLTIDEKRTRTLTFDECKGFQIAALYVAYDAVFPVSKDDELLNRCCRAIVGHLSPAGDKFSKLRADLQEAIGLSDASQQEREALLRFVSEASLYEYILASIEPNPTNDISRVTVEYDGEYNEGVTGPTNRFRALVGLGKRKFTFELPYAAESKSFHLQVEGPENTYVYDVYPIWGYSDTIKNEAVDPTRGRFRSKLIARSRLVGDQHAHVYMRDLDGGPAINLESKDSSVEAASIPRVYLEYREHPPGLLGPISIVALWLVVLTWTVGYFHNEVFRVQSPGLVQGYQGWAPVIFGVPAIVTGWILSRADAKTLRSISISTYFALCLLAVNSAMLISIAALKVSGVDPVRFEWSFIKIEHGSWTLMMASTALSFAICFGMFLSRSTRYASTINERA